MSHCRKNNWSESLENLINQQINLELFACHTYNVLHCFFLNDNIGFPGISKYFKKSSDEEMEHARKFMKYQTMRGGTVKILSLETPELSFNKDECLLYQAIEYTLNLEQRVYESIVNILNNSNDHGLNNFLFEFVKEQLETQYELGNKLQQLKTIKDDSSGLIDFDKDNFK